MFLRRPPAAPETPAAPIALSGFLHKKTSTRNEWRRRFFVLRTGQGIQLAYWYDRPSSLEAPATVPRKEFSLSHPPSLSFESLETVFGWHVEDSPLRQHAFILRMPTQSVVLAADSDEEKAAWMNAIQSEISACQSLAVDRRYEESIGRIMSPTQRSLLNDVPSPCRSRTMSVGADVRLQHCHPLAQDSPRGEDSPLAQAANGGANGVAEGHTSPRLRRFTWSRAGTSPSTPPVSRSSVTASATDSKAPRPPSSVLQAGQLLESQQRKSSRLWLESSRVAVPMAEAVTEEDEDPLSCKSLRCSPQPRLYTHLLRKLRPGQDLSKVLIPASFLERRSLLEKFADCCIHVDLLLEAPSIVDPLERFLQVFRWYCSGWRNHYPDGLIKKPYNPVIGETFACFWQSQGDKGVTEFFAEQVSHRPPVSAIFIKNAARRIKCGGQVWTRSQYKGNSALSIMDGFFSVELADVDEAYHMTMPTFSATGLLYRTMRMEVVGTTTFTCPQTGYSATVDWLPHQTCRSGEVRSHHLRATVSNREGRELMDVHGAWDDELFVTNRETEQTRTFLQLRDRPCQRKRVLPLADQGPFESRRLWRHVTRLVTQDPVDWDAVEAEKNRLEDAQRALAVHRFEGQGASWVTKKFRSRLCVQPITGKEEQLWVFDDYDQQDLPAVLSLLHLGKRFAWDGMGHSFGWRDSGSDLIQAKSPRREGAPHSDKMSLSFRTLARLRALERESTPEVRETVGRRATLLTTLVLGIALGLVLRGETVVHVHLGMPLALSLSPRSPGKGGSTPKVVERTSGGVFSNLRFASGG